MESSQTADKNLANGGIISADRLNHMETGIGNNDTNKVTDNKNGTIEVNGSSITPADDSKVVHSTVTELNSTDMNTVLTAGFYRLASGTNGMTNTDGWTLYQVINLNNTNGVQLAYGTNNNISGMRSWHTAWIKGNPVITFNSWVQVADDSKVVHTTDMRKPASDVAGIDEVSTLQTQVDNSAVGTNLYQDTCGFDNPSVWNNWGYWNKTREKFNGLAVMAKDDIYAGLYQVIQAKKGETYTFSAYARYQSGTGNASIFSTSWDSHENVNPYSSQVPLDTTWKRVSITAVIVADGPLKFDIEKSRDATGTLLIAGIKLEKGSVMTDYSLNPLDISTKADDSKVVHNTDMRKPASDVAGIEEVSAKQDKIGYTPADDSKVVHTTDTSNWQKQIMFNPGDFKIDTTSPTTDFSTLLKSKYNKAGVVYIRENNGPSFATEFIDAVVICEGGGYWYAYGIGPNGTFAHRKITEYDDTGWVINADDSKVAHLSGANNFDTVPTVDNNPLLLASSLPPDLARTGQANTFTAAQTFSIAPTITDASQDKGDNQAATMADLKSVKKSAWRIGTLPNSQGLKNITMMYKIHDDHKYIEANIYGKSITGGPKGPIMLDFSRMVNRITNIDLVFVSSASGFSEGWSRGTSPAEFAGAEISLESHFSIGDYSTNIGIISLNGGSFAKIYYDSLVNN